MPDELDRLWEAVRPTDANTLVTAVIAGALVQLLVLLVLRVIGVVLRTLRLLVASAAGVGTALYVLNRGIPRSIGGREIERWLDDARRLIGA